MRAILNDADAVLTAAAPTSDTEVKAAEEYLARKARMAHLPTPFCNVRTIRPAKETPCWEALGENEALIVVLPAETALHLKALLEGVA